MRQLTPLPRAPWLSRHLTQGDASFLTEVAVSTLVQHVNLLPVLGIVSPLLLH